MSLSKSQAQPLTALLPLLLAVVAAIGTGNDARADLLFYEGFDYGNTDGSLATVGASGNWTGDAQIGYVAEGLSYTSLQTSGGAAIGYTLDGTTYGVSSMFDTAIPTATFGGEFYFSFIIGINSADAAIGNGESGSLKIYVPQNGGDSDTGGVRRTDIPWNSDAQQYSYNYNGMSGTSTASGAMSLLVFHFPGGGDLVEYWVNPDLSGALPVDGTGTATADHAYSNRITGIRFESRNLLLQVDEIRIGTSIEDVLPVPEPGALSVLGLAGGLLLMRRRDGSTGNG